MAALRGLPQTLLHGDCDDRTIGLGHGRGGDAGGAEPAREVVLIDC